MKRFSFYSQIDEMDCGPSCLRMVAKHYGKKYSQQYVSQKCSTSKNGTSIVNLSDAAESIGFRTLITKVDYEKLKKLKFPVIITWRQRHYVVVYKINNEQIYVADPAKGLLKYNCDKFINNWTIDMNSEERLGYILYLEPSLKFYNNNNEGTSDKLGLGHFIKYLRPYKRLILQLILGMLVGSMIQVLFPFLTQAIVDVGIRNQDINFITLILFAQIVLFISRLSVEFLRGWILLHIGNRVNIAIISDFLVKLLKLPIEFYDSKIEGDILQRINDHRRVESLLTNRIIRITFSWLNLIAFSVILAYYSFQIFLVFLIGSVLYLSWILIFLKKRKEIDNLRFSQLSNNQSTIIQIIRGIQDIKLFNLEKKKRWEWESIQSRLFDTNVRSLSLTQFQQSGSSFFNELKNILITFMAAKSVIEGEITLGMMVAIQYIIGQLNVPISEMLGFIQSVHDAKISLERLNEIHQAKEEEVEENNYVSIVPWEHPIHINELLFKYEGDNSDLVINNISLTIPKNKVTAIVGSSGSGKTTLIKLLLKFYAPTSGEIKLGEINLLNIRTKEWRSVSGAILQSSDIFRDTIINNVTLYDDHVDHTKLINAVKTANIQDFIESLPFGYNTRIGVQGQMLSQGQKQRILIARIVYQNPDYVYFDEATNSLDASNEKIIMKNLNEFFVNKTVVFVAHRLSTVKNADQIIVMEKGRITETGNHQELTSLKGSYYRLIKNQLELGQ